MLQLHLKPAVRVHGAVCRHHFHLEPVERLGGVIKRDQAAFRSLRGRHYTDLRWPTASKDLQRVGAGLELTVLQRHNQRAADTARVPRTEAQDCLTLGERAFGSADFVARRAALRRNEDPPLAHGRVDVAVSVHRLHNELGLGARHHLQTICEREADAAIARDEAELFCRPGAHNHLDPLPYRAHFGLFCARIIRAIGLHHKPDRHPD